MRKTVILCGVILAQSIPAFASDDSTNNENPRPPMHFNNSPHSLNPNDISQDELRMLVAEENAQKDLEHAIEMSLLESMVQEEQDAISTLPRSSNDGSLSEEDEQLQQALEMSVEQSQASTSTFLEMQQVLQDFFKGANHNPSGVHNDDPYRQVDTGLTNTSANVTPELAEILSGLSLEGSSNTNAANSSTLTSSAPTETSEEITTPSTLESEENSNNPRPEELRRIWLNKFSKKKNEE